MTDILKPDLLWIEGRCYRINDSNTELTSFQEHDLYENDVPYDDVNDADDDDDNFDVVLLDNSRFTTSFHVSKHYIGAIIGKKGAVKCRVERDTKTDIKIPKQGQTGDIVIFGSSASSVKAARRRINIIVMSSRMKQRPTHFISIPMNSPDIMNNFETFKNNVLRDCPGRGLDESLFIKPNKLHLTLGVMCLMDNEERLLASKLLTEAKEKIILPMLEDYLPFKIRLKGLSYMNDDPREIDVLYGRVQEEGASTGLIQKLADSLVSHFYKAGYMEKDHGRDNVKLHVTLINSKYRSRAAQGGEDSLSSTSRNSRQPRVTFDGSEILRKYADYDFGVIEFKEIHLSQRHSIGNDGFYQPTCVICCST
ncbi:activating signal cointegrator 1 complex subunit 1 [Ostrinia furnacalis]|uniref:activating signal cointegrator 1 complex subunit 1 n=1 Tax=Ostrinia furnacalis TaxID=93504 RepID=UPI00103B08C0|nr:activating signal cointegrator 1 complex subunit 1 [Ostrinia furnacalis]